ncbi:RIO1 family regulatory kinase/ATPase [Eubacterium sp. 1001713B170207_170306_E7]|uniref:RIO1 family regulatory kinase/ATPase domain-containing protein n=1 Tax=Eubacterium sp. 1001713B170207_170306_E7 TaxID=2787097 RepID=UPI0018992C8F|nr:RIO1 family regulatory kinase/ATPase [Eubacterium sp. 1001713B170207_170306_E7]
MKSVLEKSKTFESRRNTVSLENEQIKKVFSDAEAAQHEWNVLKLLKKRGVAVPEILDLRENVLYLQYCPGPLLLDRVLELEEKNSAEGLADLFAELACWFEQFYRAVPGHIRGDVNFRNFIVGVSGITGIDFETLPTGRKETDAANLLAYYAAYSPAFTDKRLNGTVLMLDAFLKTFPLDKRAVWDEMLCSFKCMDKRRKDFNVNAAEKWLIDLKKEV